MHAKLAKSSGKLAHDLDYCRDKRRAMRRFRFLTCVTSGPIGKMRGGKNHHHAFVSEEGTEEADEGRRSRCSSLTCTNYLA